MFKVPVTTIKEIIPHPNADRLEIVRCYDWAVVAGKGQYSVGNAVVFVPPDSILPKELEDKLFPPDSKIKLHKSRVRAIKIRGFVSQGMLINPDEILPDTEVMIEQDVSSLLGITKFEPIVKDNTSKGSSPRNKPKENPYFHEYKGIDNIKWYVDLFEGDQVIIQEKLHGSNCRAALLPYNVDGWWRKLLKKLHLAPKLEFCYGSNRVQLQQKGSGHTGYYGFDIYAKALKQSNVDQKIAPYEIWYGEIIGYAGETPIQANYTYGCKPGECRFVLFDVKIQSADGSPSYFLLPDEVEVLAKERNVEFVPILYKGLYNKDQAFELTKGASIYCPDQKVREGIVIKSATEREHPLTGKKMLKWISEEYLLDKTNTDDH